MLRYCEERQIQGSFRKSQKRCQEFAWEKIPHLLKEREVQGTDSYDKVFAVEWLDDESFVTGTKDNKLLLWNAVTGRRLEISLPVRQGKRVQQIAACGIHSISTNFSKSLLATGANDPNDAAIFSLPTLDPVGILEDHDDWIFATAWLTDTMLATGSRDTTVKLWSVDIDGPFTNTQPLVERTDHSGKVRDLKYCAQTQLLATLGQDSTCKIWDPYGMQVVSNVALENKRELVCLALDSRLIAIGSQQHISFIDMRCGHIARHILSADDGWGVRSLSFKNNLVTCGGGKGRLSFFDLRNEKYILLGGKCCVELICWLIRMWRCRLRAFVDVQNKISSFLEAKLPCTIQELPCTTQAAQDTWNQRAYPISMPSTNLFDTLFMPMLTMKVEQSCSLLVVPCPSV